MPGFLGEFKIGCSLMYIHETFLNKCFVYLNLRRSCKLGLRRTCYHCEFIGIICSLVVKRGICSSERIPNKIFPIFGLKPRSSFLYAVLISPRFSYFVRRFVPRRLLLHPRRFPRWSPLADASDFAYASDTAEDNVCKPGHVVELSF
jgi:hypothetical protein